MALVNCPECKNKISNQAVACPQCGFPYRESIRLKKEKAAKKAAKARKSLKHRKLTVEHARTVSFKIAGLRELQEKIAVFVDDDPVLTEWEEQHLEELEAHAEDYYQIVRDWSDSLPDELQEYSDEIVSEIEDLYRRAGSFEELAQLILIDEWQKEDEHEDRGKKAYSRKPHRGSADERRIADYLERRGRYYWD